MVSVMNEPHGHKNNRHRFDKTNWELTSIDKQHRQNVTNATKNELTSNIYNL